MTRKPALQDRQLASKRQKTVQRTRRTLLLWKPYDVLSSFTTPNTSQAENLSRYVTTPGVYAAGRLDRDSEGLLLLTDDGLLQHKLCDPRFGHWRTYLVQVERIPDSAALERLASGIQLKERMTRPARVERLSLSPELPPRIPPIRLRKSVDTAWLKLSLTEGMNRQVRRMTAAVGHPTLRLIRAEIELAQGISLTLEGLSPGQYRELTSEEIKGLDMLRRHQPRVTTSRL